MSDVNTNININVDEAQNPKKHYKIAIVGDKASVIGFRSVGFVVFEVDGVVSAEETITRIAEEDYAIIFVVENLVKDLKTVIAKYLEKPIPAIIPLPGKIIKL